MDSSLGGGGGPYRCYTADDDNAARRHLSPTDPGRTSGRDHLVVTTSLNATRSGKGRRMTSRIGAMAIDGTPISATDVARMEAEEVLHTEWQRKAVLVVAGSAADADDC